MSAKDTTLIKFLFSSLFFYALIFLGFLNAFVFWLLLCFFCL